MLWSGVFLEVFPILELYLRPSPIVAEAFNCLIKSNDRARPVQTKTGALGLIHPG